MTTEAQVEANRENAKQSTGPRTLRGKARSALNALKHGFRSRIILEESKSFTDESPGPFADFLSDIVAELAPVGVLESLCVETMALSQWRQRLLIRRELELVLDSTPDQRKWHKTEEEWYKEDLQFGIQSSPPDPEYHFPNPDKLLPLMRYEAHLDRQFQRNLRQLQQLQAARFAQQHRPFHFPTGSVPNEPNDPDGDSSDGEELLNSSCATTSGQASSTCVDIPSTNPLRNHAPAGGLEARLAAYLDCEIEKPRRHSAEVSNHKEENVILPNEANHLSGGVRRPSLDTDAQILSSLLVPNEAKYRAKAAGRLDLNDLVTGALPTPAMPPFPFRY